MIIFFCFSNVILLILLSYVTYRCYKANQGVLKIDEEELIKLSLIAKNTSKAVFITDINQEIVWVNHAFISMTGFDLSEVIGKNPFDLLSGSQTDTKSLYFLKSQMELNRPFNSTIIFHKKNGSIYWSRINGQSISDDSGKIQQYFAIQEDITIQQVAKIELQDSEKRYKALFHNNPQPLVIYDKLTLKFIEANEAAEKKYGISLDEFRTLTIMDLFYDKDKKLFFENNEFNQSEDELLLSDQNFLKNEIYSHITKSGSIINVELVRNEINLFGNQVILLIIKDVTNKLLNERELRRSNERFTIASKAVRDIIWEWDIQNNQFYWGDGIIENFGYLNRNEYPTSNNFFRYIHPDDIKFVLKDFRSIFKAKSKVYWNSEFRFKKKNGDYAYVLDRAFILRSSDGEPLKMIGAMHDISEQKNHEIEKEKLVRKTQEFERKRFSMELHDGLAQQLVVLNLYLSQLNDEGIENQHLLNTCFEIVKTSLDQTRSLCYNLTPPELENGLLDALNSLFDRFKRLENFNIKYKVEKSISNLDFENIDIYNLYRIIQEFINNSIKHSSASLIECQIKKSDNQIAVALKDNGVGFDIDSVQSGLGLDNIHQRAKLANLQYKFTSKHEAGTNLEICTK